MHSLQSFAFFHCTSLTKLCTLYFGTLEFYKHLNINTIKSWLFVYNQKFELICVFCQSRVKSATEMRIHVRKIHVLLQVNQGSASWYDYASSVCETNPLHLVASQWTFLKLECILENVLWVKFLISTSYGLVYQIYQKSLTSKHDF